MRTTTSPARGASRSSSSTWSGLPCSNSTDACMEAPPVDLARVPDPRIQVAVEKIDGQVDDHEEHRDEEARALRHRIVPLVDGPEHEPTDSGEREHLLDDDRAAEQDACLQSGDGDDGDQRVAEPMLEDHEPT